MQCKILAEHTIYTDEDGYIKNGLLIYKRLGPYRQRHLLHLKEDAVMLEHA
jgi:hypothetical protein